MTRRTSTTDADFVVASPQPRVVDLAAARGTRRASPPAAQAQVLAVDGSEAMLARGALAVAALEARVASPRTHCRTRRCCRLFDAVVSNASSTTSTTPVSSGRRRTSLGRARTSRERSAPAEQPRASTRSSRPMPQTRPTSSAETSARRCMPRSRPTRSALSSTTRLGGLAGGGSDRRVVVCGRVPACAHGIRTNRRG